MATLGIRSLLRPFEGYALPIASRHTVDDVIQRLLEASDLERERLARQLHDDVGQQLAVLLMDLEMLNGLAEGEAEVLASDVFSRAHIIARKVQDLSHRLHPAELKLVGLIPALHGLRRQMLAAGMPVAIELDGVVPDLPPALAVCLFRVAEEGLQNALKHSEAREVRLRLAVHPGDDLTLSIIDDGAGFDALAPGSEGLGLTVIRKRLQAFGGTLQIASGPGRGTIAAATVPYAAAQPLETSA